MLLLGVFLVVEGFGKVLTRDFLAFPIYFFLQKCLGVTGTNGIDRLLSFQIVAELNKALGEIDGHFTRNKSITDCFAQISGCLSSETPNGIITCKFC